MNFRPLYAVALACSLLELAGCQSLLKKRDPDPAPSAAPVAVTPAVVAPVVSAPPVEAAPAAVAVDENAVPTSQDFEDDAFATVTPANFRAQFTQLKTDISKP
ncbi:MAG TPA: hypothetical protein VNW92_00340 [Polyangiaceae bacterium]|jgi:hypothetical protein|nr:hypothetical protein [Polyangiaceae bacterium]